MIIKCNAKSIKNALDQTNKKFDNNLIFKKFEFIGHTRDGMEKNQVTLTVKDSREAGGRRGFSGKRVAAACWHAHGTFFDNLPEGTEIIASGKKFYAGDEWIDRNIGSYCQPMYYSEACDCYL